MSDSVLQPVTSFPALGALPLARATSDRRSESRAQEDWLDSLRAAEGTRYLVMIGGRARVLDGELVLMPAADLPEGGTEIYLGFDGSTEIVLHSFEQTPAAWAAPGSSDELRPGQWLGLRDVAAGLGARDAGLFVEAVAIANWNHATNFCAGCGGPLTLRASGWVKFCAAEGREHFPRTDPAIIVAITDDADRLLLGANKAWGGTRFSTLAGFVDPGESLEAAVIREVAEESGVIVKNPRYMGSQPWPFPRSLMLGFTAIATGTELFPDGEEIIDLRWFTREELADAVRTGEIGVPAGVSIASALIENWFGGVLPQPEHLEN
ncbi:MAG: NAD(+) diphosphatase [Paeniglutamicibacter terrestris]|jgi:NAD+ diphosphatase